MARKVSRESHRMLGLIRFRNLPEDIYYAPIKPDFNILTILAPHFARRLPSQKWVIHDKKKGTGRYL